MFNMNLAADQTEPLHLVDVLGRGRGADTEELRHLPHLVLTIQRYQLQEVILRQREILLAHLVEELQLQEFPNDRCEDVREAQ